jgi:hypothetical protein
MVSNAKHTRVKTALATSGLSRQVANATKEAAHRALRLPTTIGDIFSTRRRKIMRLRVVILRDEHGQLVADPTAVMPSITDAQEIFLRDTNVQIVPFDRDFIVQAPAAAPTQALDVSCGAGAYTADLSDAGHYFRTHAADTHEAQGFEASVTVFIVRTMARANGCALGPIANYATVSIAGLRSRTDPCQSRSPRSAHRVLAHELGHMCGLLHSNNCIDLMYQSAGTRFTTKTQVLAVRSSRFVAAK